MKTIHTTVLLVGALVLSVALPARANYDKFMEAMKKNIAAVYNAQSIEALQQSVNAFERIGSVEKNRWEPSYYAAFGYIMMANREQDGAKKDLFLDQAAAAIEKAKAVKADDSEIIALEGFVLMLRISVDPGSRGPQFAGLAMQTLGRASALDANNPRALVLTAQMQYGTAQFFGSPATEACATVNQALEKFSSFRSDNPLAPQWGKGMAEKLKEQCK